jgi:hypothetical protein
MLRPSAHREAEKAMLSRQCISAAGYLPPVAGAIIQEVIDVAVVFNALRMAIPPGRLTDF